MMSKTYKKKKAYCAELKRQARDGKINDADGRMITRSSMKDNSMKRDYCPQQGV